jgi:competence protein ComEC
MMSIVLIAVMLDRPALTMRNVALAAIAILVVEPESAFDPSFEMSLAAVIALVALYEWFASRIRSSLSDVSAFWRILHKGSALLIGAALTTLVASAAIAPFALYRFHRMTHYGLIANLIAEPLVSFVIMPMALLSLIAMPFGLEAWPLKAMGYGIDLMVGVVAGGCLGPGGDLRPYAFAYGSWRPLALPVADTGQGFWSRHRRDWPRASADARAA